jgi:hypothetical protein
MILMHFSGHSALIARIRLLRLQATTVCAHAALGIIHSLLERVILPTEDVIPMLTETSGVSGTEDKWLSAVGGPIGLVVKIASVPDDLQWRLTSMFVGVMRRGVDILRA